jgi:hypothetical protein
VTVRTPDRTETIDCDALAVSGGWNPNLGLTCHLGSRARWNENIAAFVPGDPPKGMAVAGAANGTLTLGNCLREGSRVAEAAMDDLGMSYVRGEHARADDESFAITPLWHIASKQKAFVDFQNDVTSDDVSLAFREGFREVEHLKRYTTLGMATDQGKTSSVNGVAQLAMATGRTIAQTGRTTSRPPEVPVAIGAFAGHHRGKHFRPIRYTPSHAWASGQGAMFVESGPWLRAQYYPRAGEAGWFETVCREVTTVREKVGFCDVSTLGKIELQGKDVGAFLDRLYINTFSTLAVGRARYGLMLREDGFALDDGTTSRLSEDRFLMTTTTANAERVFQHMKFCHQVLWPELDVQLVSGTDQWAQFSVAGPRARDTLAGIVDPAFPIGNNEFPYMAAAELTVCSGVAARLYRISFSGELAYEIAVPARYGAALAGALMEAGDALWRRALWHRGVGDNAYRKGAYRRQRNRRPHHGNRSRAGANDVKAEGLYRPDPGRARSTARSATAIHRRTAADRPSPADSSRRAYPVAFGRSDIRQRPGYCHLGDVFAVVATFDRAWSPGRRPSAAG